MLKENTYKDLEKIYGFNERLFSRLAKEYDIPKNTKVIAKNSNKDKMIEFDLNYVLYLYYDLNKSLRQISEIYNCSHGAVRKFFKDNDIPIRSAYSDIYYDNRRVEYNKYNYLDSAGYQPLHVDGKQLREHIYVMERHIGRKLNKNEAVHHIDFNKSNNDIKNLFLFETNSLHKLYHGYIKTHDYILPDEFLKYYEIKLKYTLDNPNWLYKQYIENKRSCNNISKELEVSRQAITSRLKKFEIYELRNPTINQYDEEGEEVES